METLVININDERHVIEHPSYELEEETFVHVTTEYATRRLILDSIADEQVDIIYLGESYIHIRMHRDKFIERLA